MIDTPAPTHKNNDENDVEQYAVRWETLLGQITSRLDQALGKAIEHTGLSTSQCRALLFLLDHDNSTMSALSSGLAISLSAATGIVDRLVKKKLVERSRDETDRRVVRIRLSDTGSEVAGTARDVMHQYTVTALHALNRQDQDRLMKLMETIARQIGQVLPDKGRKGSKPNK